MNRAYIPSQLRRVPKAPRRVQKAVRTRNTTRACAVRHLARAVRQQQLTTNFQFSSFQGNL
jgi:hypothetical protein